MDIKIALAGARHAHACHLVKLAKNTAGVSFTGAWEEDTAARAAYAEKGVNFNYTSRRTAFRQRNTDYHDL